jgi:hypothetical protein
LGDRENATKRINCHFPSIISAVHIYESSLRCIYHGILHNWYFEG